MFGIKKCEECKQKSEEEIFDVYKEKRKIDKIKLHAKYISCISVGIVVWLVATGTAKNDEFAGWMSFASTITSIILSVIAIILSITGESKTDAIKNDLSDTARKLDNVAGGMNKSMDNTKELIEQLGKQIKVLEEKVDKVPERVNAYKNTNVTYSETENKEVRSNVHWGGNNEEG